MSIYLVLRGKNRVSLQNFNITTFECVFILTHTNKRETIIKEEKRSNTQKKKWFYYYKQKVKRKKLALGKQIFTLYWWCVVNTKLAQTNTQTFLSRTHTNVQLKKTSLHKSHSSAHSESRICLANSNNALLLLLLVFDVLLSSTHKQPFNAGWLLMMMEWIYKTHTQNTWAK